MNGDNKKFIDKITDAFANISNIVSNKLVSINDTDTKNNTKVNYNNSAHNELSHDELSQYELEQLEAMELQQISELESLKEFNSCNDNLNYSDYNNSNCINYEHDNSKLLNNFEEVKTNPLSLNNNYNNYNNDINNNILDDNSKLYYPNDCSNVYTDIQFNNVNNYNNYNDYNNFDNLNNHNFDNSKELTIKLHVMKKPANKNYFESQIDDTVEIPIFESEKLLSQDNFIVDINFENKVIQAKVTHYNAPKRMIIMPEWMILKIGAKINDFVTITLSKIKKITKIKVNVSKSITDPLTVFEYYLRNRNIVYHEEIAKFKIFDKEYIFKIEKIYNENNEINAGFLHDKNLISEIIFDLHLLN